MQHEPKGISRNPTKTVLQFCFLGNHINNVQKITMSYFMVQFYIMCLCITLSLMIYSTGEGVDYDSGPYIVTFLAGMTSVPFDVPIIDDNFLELNEKFDLTIVSSSLPNGFTVDGPSQATVTIVDDDSELICRVKSLFLW